MFDDFYGFPDEKSRRLEIDVAAVNEEL